MDPHDPHLIFRQWTRFEQYVIRDGDLADVMQWRKHEEMFNIGVIKIVFFS